MEFLRIAICFSVNCIQEIPKQTERPRRAVEYLTGAAAALVSSYAACLKKNVPRNSLTHAFITIISLFVGLNLPSTIIIIIIITEQFILKVRCIHYNYIYPIYSFIQCSVLSGEFS